MMEKSRKILGEIQSPVGEKQNVNVKIIFCGTKNRSHFT